MEDQPKTKKCSSCQTNISFESTRCPYCGRSQQNWFRRHPIISVLLGLFIFPYIIGGIGSLFGGKATETSNQPASTLTQNTPTEERQTEWITLTGSENGEVVVESINVWQKAEGGGPNNMAIGRIPHGTKVELLEVKEVENHKFYHISSTIGEHSVLSTDFNSRKRQMAEMPESSWHVKANETLVIDGWVFESFVETEP